MSTARAVCTGLAQDSILTPATFQMPANNRLPVPEPRSGPVLLGLAFDADDGHKRLTRSRDFVLAGGSEDTHSVMRETVIRVTEKLDQRGKSLRNVSAEELRDTLHDVLE